MSIPQTEMNAVADQVKRLAGLDRFPEEPAAFSELVRVLMDKCRHINHVTATIDVWLARYRRAPKPLDLAQLAEQVIEAGKQPDRYCTLCDGIGFVSYRRLVRLRNGMQYEADFAEKCMCW